MADESGDILPLVMGLVSSGEVIWILLGQSVWV